MQRKATKTTRGANADEKRFMAWVKDQPCCVCRRDGPSIVDHMYGATFKHNKVLVGHWALLPYCQEHDQIKTIHGRKAHDEQFGKTQAKLWDNIALKYSLRVCDDMPLIVCLSIEDWGR